MTQPCQCPVYKDTKTYYHHTEKCDELTMRLAVQRTEIDMATSSLLTVFFMLYDLTTVINVLLSNVMRV